MNPLRFRSSISSAIHSLSSSILPNRSSSCLDIAKAALCTANEDHTTRLFSAKNAHKSQEESAVNHLFPNKETKHIKERKILSFHDFEKTLDSMKENRDLLVHQFHLLENISERAESLPDFDEARAIKLLVACLENLKNKYGFDHRSIITWAYGLKPLHQAASEGCLTLCKSLIESGANLEEKTCPEIDAEWEDGYPIYGAKTPLHLACDSGHIHIVRELIKRGANINAASNKLPDNTYATPLLEGANNGEIILELAKNGADINEKGIHEEWARHARPI